MPSPKKVLLITDVPVEHTVHGSALLYRLFENPVDFEICIAQGTLQACLEPSRRLLNVKYFTVYTGIPRLLRNRFSKLFRSAFFLSTPIALLKLFFLCLKLRPDLLITVSHGVIWCPAYWLSRLTKIPIFVICHDDILSFDAHHPLISRFISRTFGRLYRHSLQAFPICDTMEKGYSELFGTRGTALYPSRSLNTQVKTPSEVLLRAKQFDYSIGFAGSIATKEYALMLLMLSQVLADLGGLLYIYGPHSAESLAMCGLSSNNVICKGLLSSCDLITDMHDKLDALYVPISFEQSAFHSAAYAFPSKLADYTCTSLPIVIQAPLYASAAQWASIYHGAIVVDSIGTDALKKALLSLDSQRLYDHYCYFAHEAGMKTFQHSIQAAKFFRVIQNSLA